MALLILVAMVLGWCGLVLLKEQGDPHSKLPPQLRDSARMIGVTLMCVALFMLLTVVSADRQLVAHVEQHPVIW